MVMYTLGLWACIVSLHFTRRSGYAWLIPVALCLLLGVLTSRQPFARKAKPSPRQVVARVGLLGALVAVSVGAYPSAMRVLEEHFPRSNATAGSPCEVSSSKQSVPAVNHTATQLAANPSIERTHNGEAQLRASATLSAPSRSAHVER